MVDKNIIGERTLKLSGEMNNYRLPEDLSISSPLRTQRQQGIAHKVRYGGNTPGINGFCIEGTNARVLIMRY